MHSTPRFYSCETLHAESLSYPPWDSPHQVVALGKGSIKLINIIEAMYMQTLQDIFPK